METSSPHLSPRQRAILHALLYQMVEQKEIDLTAFFEAQQAAEPTLLDTVFRASGDVLHQVHIRLGDGNPLRIVTSAAHRVATDPIVRNCIYLTRHFGDAGLSDLYFPGVSVLRVADDGDDPSDPVDRPVGSLDSEFDDAEARHALMAELHAWATRDPNYRPVPGNTIDRVRTALCLFDAPATT